MAPPPINIATTYYDMARSNIPLADTNAMRRYIQNYTYDAVGNMTIMQHLTTGGTGNWTRTFTISSVNNRLTGNSIGSNSPVAESYTYDARGNMITGMNHLSSMTYNEENRLEQVVDSAGITSYYQYDSGGQRVRKTTVDSSGGGYTKIRKYIGQWEVYIQQYTSTGIVYLQRETLNVMDDKARVAMIDTPTTIPSGSSEGQLLRYQFSNHLGTAIPVLVRLCNADENGRRYPCLRGGQERVILPSGFIFSRGL